MEWLKLPSDSGGKFLLAVSGVLTFRRVRLLQTLSREAMPETGRAGRKLFVNEEKMLPGSLKSTPRKLQTTTSGVLFCVMDSLLLLLADADRAARAAVSVNFFHSKFLRVFCLAGAVVFHDFLEVGFHVARGDERPGATDEPVLVVDGVEHDGEFRLQRDEIESALPGCGQ